MSDRERSPASLYAAPAPRTAWYAVGRSQDLRDSGVWGVVLLGEPIVVFRDGLGRPRALQDRCPHRNVPLSIGSVRAGRVVCAYHGWEIDGEGRCRHVPAHRPGALPLLRTPVYATREQDGLIWVYGEAGVTPPTEPYQVPHVSDDRYTTTFASFTVAGSLHALLENTLDVPHTAFLHGGLFRSAERQRTEVRAEVRRRATHVEAEFVGERAPPGLAGRLLAPTGGAMTHIDRFLLPSIAQVEYRMGPDAHFLLTSLCSPAAAGHVRLIAVGSFRLGRISGAWLAPLIELVSKRIFAQDAWILALQQNTIGTLGERYCSTEIDLLGRHMALMLEAAARGEPPPPDLDESIPIWI